jgi:hypothetical protein
MFKKITIDNINSLVFKKVKEYKVRAHVKIDAIRMRAQV